MARKQARIRMYRTGLGDCFLLTFPGAKAAKPVHLLIDCGVFIGTKGEKARMRAIAEDIGKTTKQKLDFVVCTHEHYDHQSGFLHARDLFEGMTVGTVWLSWSERPGDPRAAWLRAVEAKLRMGLQLALQQAKADPALAARAGKLEELLSFDGNVLAADYSEGMGEVKRWLRDDLADAVEYLEPHGPALEIAPQVRAYVLGPPLAEAAFRRLNDSKSDPQTYHLQLALSAVPAFLSLGAVEGDRQGLGEPFDGRWKVSPEMAQGQPFFAERYGFDEKHPDRWRWIEDDWLGAAESLALQLNSLTNNSSLALAIEVGRSRRVLLMAADAQVGNWLSWHEGEWTAPGSRAGSERTVTAEELLARTVLYKVGHHGSHNATLKDRGLELMTSEDLVAMIPVDEDFARNRKGWDMPFPPLLEALETRTKGRILRADTGLPARGTVKAAVREGFFARTAEEELYVEYRVDF